MHHSQVDVSTNHWTWAGHKLVPVSMVSGVTAWSLNPWLVAATSRESNLPPTAANDRPSAATSLRWQSILWSHQQEREAFNVISPCLVGTCEWIRYFTTSPYVSSNDVSDSCIYTCSCMLLLSAGYDTTVLGVRFAQAYEGVSRGWHNDNSCIALSGRFTMPSPTSWTS